MYGPSGTTTTTLGAVKKEFDITVVGAKDLLETLEKNTEELNKSFDEGQKVFNDAKQQIKPVEDSISQIEGDYISRFREIRENTVDALKSAFFGLFAVCILFALIFFISTYVFVSCQKPCLRYLSHCSWCFTSLITIPLFLLASVFGLLGVVLIYLGPIAQILLSNEGLKSLFGQDSSSTIGICLNGDGDLGKVFAGDMKGYTSSLDQFYNVSLQLKNITETMANTQGSAVIKQLDDYFTKLNSDVVLAGGTDEDAPAVVVVNLNSYSQKSSPGSKQDSCSGRVDDQWVSDRANCPSDYPYLDASVPKANLGEQVCLNIRDWTKEKVEERYVTSPSCSNFNPPQKIGSFITSINQYGESSSPHISAIKSDLSM